MPLLSHIQLPHLGSVTDQPKQVLPLTRRRVIQQPKPEGHLSGDVTLLCSAPGSAPGRTRTCDLEIRRLLLYPAELRGRGIGIMVQEKPRYTTGVVRDPDPHCG